MHACIASHASPSHSPCFLAPVDLAHPDCAPCAHSLVKPCHATEGWEGGETDRYDSSNREVLVACLIDSARAAAGGSGAAVSAGGACGARPFLVLAESPTVDRVVPYTAPSEAATFAETLFLRRWVCFCALMPTLPVSPLPSQPSFPFPPFLHRPPFLVSPHLTKLRAVAHWAIGVVPLWRSCLVLLSTSWHLLTPTHFLASTHP